MLPATRRRTARCCSRSSTSPARSSAPKASSIFLLDEEADELVFEAVSGEGEGALVGMRFPSSTGIAGWVLVTRQPIVIDDLSRTRASRATGRGDRLRADEPDGRAAPQRRALARRALGARPRSDDGPSRWRRSTSCPVRDAGRDRARPAAPARRARARSETARAERGARRAHRRASRRDRRGRGPAPARGARDAPALDAQPGPATSGADPGAPTISRRESRLRRSSRRPPCRRPSGPRRPSPSSIRPTSTLSSSNRPRPGGGPRSPRPRPSRPRRHRPARARPTCRVSFRWMPGMASHPTRRAGADEIFPHLWCGLQSMSDDVQSSDGRALGIARVARRGLLQPGAAPAAARVDRLDHRQLGVPRRARRLRVRPGRRGGGRHRRADPDAARRDRCAVHVVARRPLLARRGDGRRATSRAALMLVAARVDRRGRPVGGRLRRWSPSPRSSGTVFRPAQSALLPGLCAHAGRADRRERRLEHARGGRHVRRAGARRAAARRQRTRRSCSRRTQSRSSGRPRSCFALRGRRSPTSAAARRTRPTRSVAVLGGDRDDRPRADLRTLVGLYAAQTLVAGALNVLVVVTAFELLDLRRPASAAQRRARRRRPDRRVRRARARGRRPARRGLRDRRRALRAPARARRRARP